MSSILNDIIGSVLPAVTRVGNRQVAICDNLIYIYWENSYLFSTDITPTGMFVGFDSFDIEYILSGQYEYPELYSKQDIYNTILYLYGQYDNITKTNRPSASIDDLRAYEDFRNKFDGMKSADGARFVYINGDDYRKRYLFPVFTGFPMLNKPDKMGIRIYDINDRYYMVESLIYKQKLKKTFRCFSRYLNMDKPLIHF